MHLLGINKAIQLKELMRRYNNNNINNNINSNSSRHRQSH